MERLPLPSERNRSGGAGVYYHVRSFGIWITVLFTNRSLQYDYVCANTGCHGEKTDVSVGWVTKKLQVDHGMYIGPVLCGTV